MTGLFYSRYWNCYHAALVAGAGAAYGVLFWLAEQRLSAIPAGSVRWAVAFIAVQAVVLGLLTAGIIVSKFAGLRIALLKAQRLRVVEGSLVRYLAGNDDSRDELLADCAKRSREFLEVVERAYLIFRETMLRERLGELVRQSPVYPRLLEQARDERPRQASAAVSLLAAMNDAAARNAVREALQHRSGFVRTAAQRGLLIGTDYDGQQMVLDQIPELSPLQRIVVFHLIPIDSPIVKYFLDDMLASPDAPRVLGALEFVLSRQRILRCGPLDAVIASPEAEVRIKLFRALPFLNSSTEPASLLDLGLADADWRVQAMAARACGILQIPQMAPRLLEICRTSAVPVVTTHAARSLAMFGPAALEDLMRAANEGPELLQRIALEIRERLVVGQSVVVA